MLADRSLDFLADREEERRDRSLRELPEGLKRAIEATRAEIARASSPSGSRRIRVSVKSTGKSAN